MCIYGQCYRSGYGEFGGGDGGAVSESVGMMTMAFIEGDGLKGSFEVSVR